MWRPANPKKCCFDIRPVSLVFRQRSYCAVKMFLGSSASKSDLSTFAPYSPSEEGNKGIRQDGLASKGQ